MRLTAGGLLWYTSEVILSDKKHISKGFTPCSHINLTCKEWCPMFLDAYGDGKMEKHAKMIQTNFRGDDEFRVFIIVYVFEHFCA